MRVQEHILWEDEEFRLVPLGSPRKLARIFSAPLSSVEASSSGRLSALRVEKWPPAALGHKSVFSSRVPAKVPGPALISCGWVMCPAQNQLLWPRKGNVLTGGAWLGTHLAPGTSAGKQSVIEGPGAGKEHPKSH